jgi:ribosomal protein S15P/S13E
MQKTILKEVKIKLPSDLADTISGKEILNMLTDKALTMTEHYHSRCKEFEEKYGIDFGTFKKKVEATPEEVFSEWDDMLVWEGFELAYNEWKKKVEVLKSCKEY